MTQTKFLNDSDYTYEEVSIEKIKELLQNGYKVEVESPDGYTDVLRYVEKGPKWMFNVKCNNKSINASYDHLFETNEGWILTKDLNSKTQKILCDDGKYHSFILTDLNKTENVVDIEVANKKHRYFTDGLSSHNTNIGKTLIMCSIASALLLVGMRVLYVTFEDSEVKIGQRIMQNLFDINQTELRALSKDAYKKLWMKNTQQIGHNKLIIKEYSEGCINALALKALIRELKDKRGFVPDVLIVDYIGCMVPNGRPNVNENDNSKLREICAQVRSIGMEMDIPVLSAAQSNRGGYGKGEIGLDDAADSFGQTMKADVIFGVTQSPELKEGSMYLVKLLKTRYGQPKCPLATIGVDIGKQRIFDLKTFNNNAVPKQGANIFNQPQEQQPVSASNIEVTQNNLNTFEF